MAEMRAPPPTPSFADIPRLLADSAYEPAEATNYPLLAQEAARALKSRQNGYPAQVRVGKMTQADADEAIAAWQAIADDWHWIATGQGTSINPHWTLHDRIAALDHSLVLIERAMREDAQEHRRPSDNLSFIGGLHFAMRWHCAIEQRGPSTNTARFCARLGHEWRAQHRPDLIARPHSEGQNDQERPDYQERKAA